jgi:hypothetical protein
VQLIDTVERGGRRLLGPADAADLRAGHGGIEAPGVAVGADAVRHRHPGIAPRRHRPAGGKVDVVGMGGDDERLP